MQTGLRGHEPVPKVNTWVHIPTEQTAWDRIEGGLAQVRMVVPHFVHGKATHKMSLVDVNGESLGRYDWESQLREQQGPLSRLFAGHKARRVKVHHIDPQVRGAIYGTAA